MNAQNSQPHCEKRASKENGQKIESDRNKRHFYFLRSGSRSYNKMYMDFFIYTYIIGRFFPRPFVFNATVLYTYESFFSASVYLAIDLHRFTLFLFLHVLKDRHTEDLMNNIYNNDQRIRGGFVSNNVRETIVVRQT